MGRGIFFPSLGPIEHVLCAPFRACLLFHQCCSPLQHPKSQKMEGERAGTTDVLSALDFLCGRLVEWADGGGRKEGVVSAAWHQW